MNNIKVGDVVYLNSDSRILLTVTCTNCSNGGIQCVYFNTVTQEFTYTKELPVEAVTKA